VFYALMPSCLSRQSSYVVLRRRLPTGAWLLALALAVGGCSLSYQLDNIDDGGADQTGSVPVAAPPAEEDLVIARAAVNEVLTKGGKHTSLRWENPKTGAHGTVTPLASTYQQSGLTCRDFLTSYVKNGRAWWLQGKACHARRGKWEVRNLRPWITPGGSRRALDQLVHASVSV
jgi:surface antigen